MTTTTDRETRLGFWLRIVGDAVAHLEWLDPVQRALVVENVAHAVYYAEQDEVRRRDATARPPDGRV